MTKKSKVLGHTELNEALDVPTYGSPDIEAVGVNPLHNTDGDALSSESSKIPEKINLISLWAMVQTGFDLAAMTVLFRSGDFATSASIIAVGLVVATFLRISATFQYWQDVGLLFFTLNYLTGSRFGYSGYPDVGKMRRQTLTVQASDPLTLHCIADVVQQSFSGYAVFVALLAEPGYGKAILIISVFISCVSMLIGVATHLPYGHLIVMVSVYVAFSIIFFLYNIIAVEFGDLGLSSDYYTGKVVYGWVRFMGMFSLAFISIGLAQNFDRQQGVPKLLLLFAVGLFLFDLASTIIFQSRPDFFQTEEQPRPDQEKHLVQALIHGNIACDILMIAHGIANMQAMKKYA